MTTIIKDGSGSGHAAKVDCYNRLKTQSTIVTLEHFSNIHDGQAYSMVFAQTPEAGARFVVIQNLSSHNMVIEGVMLWAQSDEKIGVGIGSLGIPLDVTSVEPTNLNAGSNNSAIGVFGVGTNITGLTGGCNVTNYRLKGNDSSKWFNFNADIILPRNGIFCMSATNGSILIEGHVLFVYDMINGC